MNEDEMKKWLDKNKKSKSEKDPSGILPGEPGCKMDADKPQAELLIDFGLALMAVAEVCTYGAKKYSLGGWQHVDKGYSRYTGAMLRHLFERTPDPSGLSHDAHVAWNALARLELRLRQES